MRQRRYLPSQAQLLAFEAVMRHGSTTAAASEMHLTQSTVSRLIQSLEGQLGVELFTRHRKKLIPSEAARSYCEDISNGLDIIQRASMNLIANPSGGRLALAVLPTFATRWLGPRLGRFLDGHPGVSVNLSTRIGKFGFDTERFDAAIHFGEDDWPGAQHLRLFEERLTACASQSFLARNPVATPQDVAALPLLQLETRAAGWDDWFAAHGTSVRGSRGMMMDQFSMMIQAAITGLGIALLPDYLAQIEIAEGRLAPVLQEAVPGRGAYWLIWPANRDAYPPLVHFREWIASEARAAAVINEG